MQHNIRESVVAAAGLAATFAASTAFAQASLTVLDADPAAWVWPRAVNASGHVVGWIEVLGEDGFFGPVHAKLWDARGAALPIQLGEDVQESILFDINRNGRMLGRVDRGDGRGMVYVRVEPDGAITEFTDPVPGLRLGAPIHLNDAGQTVGYAYASDNQSRTILWNPDGSGALLDDPSWDFSYPQAINNAGAVVSNVAMDGVEFAGIIAPDRPPLLYRDPNAWRTTVTDINDRGQVIGTSIQWVLSQWRPVPLLRNPDGTLVNPLLLGGPDSTPVAINNRGVVVGYAPDALDADGWIWTPRFGIRSLKSLLPPEVRGRVFRLLPEDLSDTGYVVGQAYYDAPGERTPGIAGLLLHLCPADFNLDARVDVLDLLDYLAAFRERDPYADVRNPGAHDPDAADLLAFLQAFRAACPTE